MGSSSPRPRGARPCMHTILGANGVIGRLQVAPPSLLWLIGISSRCCGRTVR